MLSKIGVEIPGAMPLQSEVGRFAAMNPYGRTSKHYRATYDLRKIGIPVILHWHHRRTHTHQAELIGSDAMSYMRMLDILGSVVRHDPRRLRLMRIDLSADVPGYSLDWFKGHVRVPRRRTVIVYGKQSGELRSGLHYGGRRDLFRIYDKREELKRRRRPLDFPFSTWLQGQVPQQISRVERQLQGEKIPLALRSFGSLESALTYNPFAPIRFEKSCRVPFGKGTVRNVLAAIGLERLIELEGQQVARSLINKHSSGNASRIIKSLATAYQPSEGPDLFDIYRNETLAQLEAAWTRKINS